MRRLGRPILGLAFRVALAVLGVGAGVAGAADSRIALVVGNSAYLQVPKLTNPARDAETIAETFRQIGFKTVTLKFDLGRDALNTALHAFAREAEKADWAVVYYAGHGIEFAGVNYVVPTDATLASDRDVQFETLPLAQILGAVEGARKLRLVILDACRDNPFLGRMKRSLASRSIGRGLARVEPGGGVLVAFAAKEGEVALDGEGNNSPFTSALVKHVRTPGLEISRLFRRVRSEVLVATDQRQEPYVYGSLPDEDFFFTAPPPEKPAALVAEKGPADRLNGAEAVEPPSSLTGGSPARPPAGGAVKPVVAGLESQDARAASSDTKASAAELPPEPPPVAAVVATPPPGPLASLDKKTEPLTSDRPRITAPPSPQLARAVQSELHRLGCAPGPIDGAWDEKSRTALGNYARLSGRTLDPDGLDDAVVAEMRTHRQRVCPLVCQAGYVARKDACVATSCTRGQVRSEDGECIAASRPRLPEKAVAHVRDAPEPVLRRKPVEAASPRIVTPPARSVVAAPKPVARIMRSAPARSGPSSRCQVFNDQSVCD